MKLYFFLFAVGEDADINGVNESSALLFNTFYDSDKVNSVESSKLKQIFGPYATSLAKKAFDTVQQLVNFLPEVSSEISNDKSQKDFRKYFGSKIKVNLNFNDKDLDKLFENFDESHSSNDHGDKFLQTFKNKLFIDSKTNHSFGSGAAAAASSSQEEKTNNYKFSSSWLYNVCSNHVNSNSCSLSTNELTSAIFDVISSSKLNDQIQNELFDLLGFEAFDLILQILENRVLIVDAACDTQQQQHQNQEYQFIDPTRKRDKPIPGSQVTIQVCCFSIWAIHFHFLLSFNFLY